MTASFSWVLRTFRGHIARERTLIAVGLVGITLGGILAVAATVRGPSVPPEGNLWETAVFDGSVGVFMITMAALVPLVSCSIRGKRVWLAILGGSTVFGYALETIQAFRGLDPRFSQVGGPVDQILGGVFLLTALAIAGCFTVLAVKLIRRPATPLLLAIRYGLVASWLAFGIGVFMSFSGTGRAVGDAGNLLPLHAVGFHGLQAVPLVALLLAWAGASNGVVRRAVHAAGAAWLLGCFSIAWQALSGRSLLTLTAPTVVAAVVLIAWAWMLARALRTWVRAASPAA